MKPSASHPNANETCINCMRCVQVCSLQARELPAPFLEGAGKLLEEKVAGCKLPQLFGV